MGMHSSFAISDINLQRAVEEEATASWTGSARSLRWRVSGQDPICPFPALYHAQQANNICSLVTVGLHRGTIIISRPTGAIIYSSAYAP